MLQKAEQKPTDFLRSVVNGLIEFSGILNQPQRDPTPEAYDNY
jgi:hypothetical protein